MKNIKTTSISNIALLILVIFFYSCNNRSALKERGIKTTATVVGGASTKKRGRNFSTYKTYEIKLEFETESGKTMNVVESVSQQEYDKVYLNCEIPIVYLPDDPTIVDVVLSDKDVLFYYGIANRALFLDDLYKVYNESNTDSITSHLNKVSFKWVYNTRKATTYWENQNKKELISINSGVLTYITYNYTGYKNISSDIESNGFIKTQRDSTGTDIFENEQYKIALSKKIDKNEQSLGFTRYFVINMVKTDND